MSYKKKIKYYSCLIRYFRIYFGTLITENKVLFLRMFSSLFSSISSLPGNFIPNKL